MWLVWREVVCFKSPVLWAGCLAGAPVPYPRNQGNQRRHQQELPVQNLLPVRPPHFGCIRGQGPPGWVLVILDEQMHPCFSYSAASERRLQRSYLVTITAFLLRMSLAWHCLGFSYFFFSCGLRNHHEPKYSKAFDLISQFNVESGFGRNAKQPRS